MNAVSLFQSSSDFEPLTITDTYHENNRVTLHQGNAQTFLQTIPDNTISLVITSPPYNIGKAYE